MALFKPMDGLNLNENYLVVAAIDLGTTYSGYAFSFRANPNNISMNRNWGSSTGAESLKCPTSVLTAPDGSFQSFGFEAEEEYNQLEGDTGHQLYRHFKMELHREDFTIEGTVLSLSGHPEKAITIFSMVLKFLMDHMLRKINTNTAINRSDIRWVLTVPAIWSNEAKHFMRDAAFKAGLIDEPDSKSLMIALEPEAASFYCRLNKEDPYTNAKFRTGDKMLIIDAGGGTVDITAHELLIDGQVKEIVKPSGGPWGGLKVDAKFMTLLKHVFGSDYINYLKSKHPQQWLDFITRFEKSKKAFKADGRYTIKLSITATFDKVCREMKGKDMESLMVEAADTKMTFSNGFLVVRHDVVLELYKDSCTSIVNHVQELLKTPDLTGLQHIVLVGGYGESMALQNALTQAFGSRCKVVVPLSPQLAIVKGAVWFGHMPSQISSRVSIATYGCQADLLFDDRIHEANRKYKSKRDGQLRCRGTFHEFVKIGDKIKNPEVKTHTFHPLSKEERQVTIPFLMSTKENVTYCDEPEVYRVGKIKLKSPSGTLSDDIEVRVTFGHTEILVEARDTKRGDEFPVKTSLDFSINK